MNDVKKRMDKLGISQVEMIFELRQRGFKIQPPALSNILSGVYTYPKAIEILSECERVLKEREG
jgi:hypothetical protein